MHHPLLVYGLSGYLLIVAGILYWWSRTFKQIELLRGDDGVRFYQYAPNEEGTRLEVRTCTRQEPHVCTVNGPCNGFPKNEGLNGRMPTKL